MTTTLTARSYGGTRQLSIADERDLAAVDALDPARWAATSVPVGDLTQSSAMLRIPSSGRRTQPGRWSSSYTSS